MWRSGFDFKHNIPEYAELTISEKTPRTYTIHLKTRNLTDFFLCGYGRNGRFHTR